jgi:hypothetical protein
LGLQGRRRAVQGVQFPGPGTGCDWCKSKRRRECSEGAAVYAAEGKEGSTARKERMGEVRVRRWAPAASSNWKRIGSCKCVRKRKLQPTVRHLRQLPSSVNIGWDGEKELARETEAVRVPPL